MTDSFSALSAGVRAAHGRATLVKYLLITGLILNVLALGSGWAQHELLAGVQRGAELTTAAASANDARERAIAWLQVLLLLGTAICWLRWQHRAYANLRLLGSRETENTPGWSVGYWFIPLINLFRPYQITTELYRRSEIQNGRDMIGGLSGPPLVGVWWFAYLGWNFTGRFHGMMINDAKTLPALISATNVGLAVEVVGIVATILAIQVIRAIDRFQLAFPVTDHIAAS